MIKDERRSAMPDFRKLTKVTTLAQRTLRNVFPLVIASTQHTYSRLHQETVELLTCLDVFHNNCIIGLSIYV